MGGMIVLVLKITDPPLEALSSKALALALPVAIRGIDLAEPGIGLAWPVNITGGNIRRLKELFITETHRRHFVAPKAAAVLCSRGIGVSAKISDCVV